MFLIAAAIARTSVAVADDVQSAATSSGPIGVRLSFQGDIVGKKLAKVLDKTYDQSPSSLQLAPYPVGEDDTICGILQKRNYPPPCEAYLQLIDRINNAPVSQNPLQPNMLITLPGVEVIPERSIRVFTKSIPDENKEGNELLRNWRDLNAAKIDHGDSFAVQFTAYDLLLSTPDEGAAIQLFNQLEPQRKLSNSLRQFGSLPVELIAAQ
jgi:hypothetical protein